MIEFLFINSNSVFYTLQPHLLQPILRHSHRRPLLSDHQPLQSLGQGLFGGCEFAFFDFLPPPAFVQEGLIFFGVSSRHVVIEAAFTFFFFLVGLVIVVEGVDERDEFF